MEQNQEQPKPRRRVKKAKGHGGHHGGAWKVAYADFVTAMMALFLVLWLVSQADTELKEQLANYFRSPGVFDTMAGGILAQAKKVSKEPTSLTSKDDEQTLFSVAQNLQKKFATRPEFSKYKDQLRIMITDEGLKINLIDAADQVSFPSGSAELTEEAKIILKEIAEGICSLPNKINIGGHTDSHNFSNGNGYTNWELSADRANAARRVLESVCVKPEQINRIIGYADTDPLVPDDPYAPANRRISITVLRLPIPEMTTGEGEENEPEKENEKDFSPGAKPSIPDKSVSKKKKEVVSEPEEGADEDADPEKNEEKPKARKKLLEEGAVKIGEPDLLPDKPKTKEKGQ
ncbi:MAG: flagellar motor protein MotB [Pyrinomonadaceae bacterium]